MAICAVVDVNGFIVIDGAVSPPNCAYLLVSQIDYNNLQSSVFTSLTADQGALIAGAVLALWAVGYGLRQVIRSLNLGG